MKNSIAYGFFAFALIVAAFFMRKGVAPRTPVIAAMPEAPADQLPPTPAAGQGPFVNTARLQKLAADSSYKGPSYKEDYAKPEYMMAAKKRVSDRLPASNGEEPKSK